MTTPEILPCPWCGGDAEVYDCEWTPGSFIVNCENSKCYAEGPRIPGRKEAIAAWNRVAAMPGLLRELTYYGTQVQTDRNTGEDTDLSEIWIAPMRWLLRRQDALETPNPKEKE